MTIKNMGKTLKKLRKEHPRWSNKRLFDVAWHRLDIARRNKRKR
jgi:hypothetical protein